MRNISIGVYRANRCIFPIYFCLSVCYRIYSGSHFCTAYIERIWNAMFAHMDRSKILRCPHCQARLGHGVFVPMADGRYSRVYLRFDRDVAYRAIDGGTSVATHTADCATCGAVCAVVDIIVVKTRSYDKKWIAHTLKTKAILGLPAA